MPDVTVKDTKINGYYIFLDIRQHYNSFIYKVAMCPLHDEFLAGYPEYEMTYPLSKKRNAYATYNRYCRKAKERS